MKKGKDLRLVNIYISIHNKKLLTMDDLAYLARYNPECFRITCDNLLYKIPETKTLVSSPEEPSVLEKKQNASTESRRNIFDMAADEKLESERIILHFFESLKKIESCEVGTLHNIDATRVKELVGSLFMEYLFPHNDQQGYFEVNKDESAFNVRV